MTRWALIICNLSGDGGGDGGGGAWGWRCGDGYGLGRGALTNGNGVGLGEGGRIHGGGYTGYGDGDELRSGWGPGKILKVDEQ